MAAFYGGIAFVIVQIIDGTFEVMGIPAWVSRFVIIFLALGFPIAVGLAWIFDITPEGIVRTGRRSTGKLGTSNRALIAVTIAAVAFGIWGSRKPDVSEEISIAVLPFANMSLDPEQEYFSDGVTEELINALAKISGISVAARTSSFAFKGKNQDIRAIGASLNVNHLLEGSVRRAGDRVRITAQLIKVDDGFNLWSESYERPMTDIFAVQDEISAAIAKALATKLLPDSTRPFEPSQKAYDAYLRARFHLAKRTVYNIEEAVKYFREAVNQEPDYAEAWSGLSKSSVLLTAYDERRHNDQHLLDQAFRAAKTALSLDSTLAEGHMAMAMHLGKISWDHDSKKMHLMRAYELDPNDTEVLNFLGDYYTWMWDWDNALEIESMAAEGDPLSLANKTDLAIVYIAGGNFDKARALIEQAIALDINYTAGHDMLAEIGYLSRDKKLMRREIDWLRANSTRNYATYYDALIRLLIKGEDTRLSELDTFVSMSAEGLLSINEVAYLYHEYGDLDRVAQLLSLQPWNVGPEDHVRIQIMANSLRASNNPAHRAALEKPEHKAFFDDRLKR
ncbi:MAG: hypothetical protein IIA59_07000 [Candidatus Marinimicrobia bacterium]|nr:hypothetical protein [Candidatus Neomarinimicrobiota bacterium]